MHEDTLPGLEEIRRNTHNNTQLRPNMYLKPSMHILNIWYEYKEHESREMVEPLISINQ